MKCFLLPLFALLMWAAAPHFAVAQAEWTYEGIVSSIGPEDDEGNPLQWSSAHGVAVDPDGKIWVQPFGAKDNVQVPQMGNALQPTRVIYVFNADGTLSDLSPIKFVSSSDGAINDTLGGFWDGDSWEGKSGRGISTDMDGNILVSQQKTLYKLDYKTGLALAKNRFPDFCALTEATASNDHIFVAAVCPTKPIIMLDPDDLTIVGNAVDAAPGFSRDFAVSPDGHRIFWAGYANNAVIEYARPDESSPYNSMGVVIPGVDAESFGFDPAGRLWVSAGSLSKMPNDYIGTDGMPVATSWSIQTHYAFDIDDLAVDMIPTALDSIKWDVSTAANAHANNMGVPQGDPRGIAFSPDGNTAYICQFNQIPPSVQKFERPASIAPSHSLLPSILRLGGGDVTIRLDDGTGRYRNLQVHHYVIGDGDAVLNPTMIASAGGDAVLKSFLIGGLALVTLDDSGTDHMLTISPIATGSFKIALSPDGFSPLTTGADSDNMGTPREYVIYSANAPMLTGKADGTEYNQEAVDDNMMISLTPRDNVEAKAIEVIPLFSDPDDVSLTYTAKADPIKREKDGKMVDTDIVSATIVSNKLMISLTDQGGGDDDTDVWLIAEDAAGEQARKRYQITTSSPSNPYIAEGGLEDQPLREDGDAVTIALAGGFKDDDLGGRSLEIEVTKISDDTATKLGEGADFTWVASVLTAKVTGNKTATPMIELDPHNAGAGSVTFTVVATDKGPECRTGFTKVAKDMMSFQQTAGTPPTVDRCIRDDGTYVAKDDSTGTYPDSKSAMTTFTANVVTKTTPSAGTAIPTLELVSDADASGKKVNLEDVNPKASGDQAAFNNYMQDLSYTVELAKNGEKDVAMATVEGSVITVVPIWRRGDKTVKATVTATNGLEESAKAEFMVKVGTATVPVVNPVIEDNPLAAAALAAGFMVERGKRLSVDLTDLRGAIKENAGGGAEGDAAVAAILGAEAAKAPFPLFIDPNANPKDLLPGGLDLKIRPEDVTTARIYAEQSMDNDIFTSMGHLVLDSKAGVLTFKATAPNTMTITIHGMDRERKQVMATTMITVPEKTSAEGDELPREVSLSQNYPNPFNPQTTIEYALPAAGDVSLIVYDMLGREVTTLLNGPQTAGRHTVNFDAAHLSNGTYVYRLVAPNKTITRTMVLVK